MRNHFLIKKKNKCGMSESVCKRIGVRFKVFEVLVLNGLADRHMNEKRKENMNEQENNAERGQSKM